MRQQLNKSTLALLVCAPFFTGAAHSAQWNGSYSAQGQCFCIGNIEEPTAGTIVKTPVGGQTILQVCERIGEGPGLTISGGKYSSPVYVDLQCGNTIALNGDRSPLNKPGKCADPLRGKAGQSDECRGVGPKWDLSLAYSKKPVVAAANPTKTNTKDSNNTTVAQQSKTSAKQRISEPSNIVADAGKATELPVVDKVIDKINNTPAVKGGSIYKDLPKGFTGRVVYIGGQRYFQAKSNIAERSALPSSRIILDDQVFLLDDGSIEPSMLYQGLPASARAVKQKPSQNSLPIKKANTAKKTNVEKKSVAAVKTKQPAVLAGAMPLTDPTVPNSFDELRATKLQGNVKDQALGVDPGSQISASQTLAARKLPMEHPELAEISTKLPNGDENQKVTSLEISKSILTNTATPTANASQIDSVEGVAGQVNSSDTQHSAKATSVGASSLSALKLPDAVRASGRDFSYIESMPVSFDFGGAGVMLEGSAVSHSRFQYMGRIGVATSYNEMMVGAGYYLTPAKADRFTMVLLAGIEYGSFLLSDSNNADVELDFDSSGFYLGAATRYVLNHRFELKAGVGYSSFFEGDAIVFGGGYYHITRRLDLVSRFEVGDNDLLGIGVRYYYK